MKVLIMGLGSIARKHVAALRRIVPQVEIAALRSSATATPEPGVASFFSEAEAQAFAPDFVIVSTPSATHADSIRTAMRFNVPLFIEKPLLHSLEDAAVAEELIASGRLHYVACNLRFLECLQFVKEAIATRGVRVNEVYSYCGSWLPGWRPDADFRQVYSARPEMGGGVHIDLIHEIDYLYWIFGMPTEVRATLRNRSSLGIMAIDYANYCLSYPHFCASVVLNYYRRDYRRTLEIVWEDETWFVDLARNRVTVADGRTLFESLLTIADTYESQMRYFIELINSGAATSFNTAADALRTLRIALSEY